MNVKPTSTTTTNSTTTTTITSFTPSPPPQLSLPPSPLLLPQQLLLPSLLTHDEEEKSPEYLGLRGHLTFIHTRIGGAGRVHLKRSHRKRGDRKYIRTEENWSNEVSHYRHIKKTENDLAVF